MPLPRPLLTALIVALNVAPAAAQPAPPAAVTRESTIIVYGDDPCPQPENENEAVVCARKPEEERYRIPRQIRERQPTETSWASRVAGLDDESRPMRPNSCSVVGSGGQTGCMQTMIRQWFAERAARRAAEAGIP
ncbi:MAG TPA: hypothetical protein VGO55_01715 [Allosphingosinicella sp.]|nr:hypothetical protein [Allosphingosinicella sp.]